MSFARNKAEGTLAEWLLADLLAEHGFTVVPHQTNRDLGTSDESAAKALDPDGSLRLPDLEVIAPLRLGIEAKSKEPRQIDGSFGWDIDAFRRPEQWQERCGVPVIYAIRDKTIVPLPKDRRQPDNLAAWRCASLHALREHEPDRFPSRIPVGDGDGETKPKTILYWPGKLFWPLADLLEGRCFVAPALLRPKPPWGVGRIL